NIDLSFGGSFPTEGQNQARKGMPNLDWTFEVGPRLLYYFYKDPQWGQVRAGLPLRASFSTDFSNTRYLGFTIAPDFQMDRYDFAGIKNLSLYTSATLNYLSEGLADYFFQITPSEQTAERMAYDAKAGLMSWETSIGFRYDYGSQFYLAGYRYSDLSISANRDSYLHRTNSNWSYVVSVGFTMFESEDRVPLEYLP
ncbi:MAG: MipA/OmpV family protein, partial [Bdellovibrionaceae bacterium]|nr:MipA/OmpV family protein [Pseudobdellovibrionaceae bacterium]